MRSLYTDDIPGSHPRIRHYEKKIYRVKNQQLEPHNYNTLLVKGQLPYNSQAYYLTRNQNAGMQNSYAEPSKEMYNSSSLIRERPQINNSQIIDWRKVDLASSQSRLRSEEKDVRTRLAEIGKRSIFSLPKGKVDDQPYFPHYLNPPKDHNTNKLTGNRAWNPEHRTEVIYVPSYKGPPKE